jgi:hypothetical protein
LATGDGIQKISKKIPKLKKSKIFKIREQKVGNNLEPWLVEWNRERSRIYKSSQNRSADEIDD